MEVLSSSLDVADLGDDTFVLNSYSTGVTETLEIIGILDRGAAGAPAARTFRKLDSSACKKVVKYVGVDDLS